MYEMEGPRRFDSSRASDRSVAGSAEPATCDVDLAGRPGFPEHPVPWR